MTSTFIFALASPSRMMEPLPKSFSICRSALSNASFLSIAKMTISSSILCCIHYTKHLFVLQ